MLGQSGPVQSCTVQSTGTVQDKFLPSIISKPTTSLWKLWACPKKMPRRWGIGYAPKGMMKGYVAIPIKLPTGELTVYIGVTEANCPKNFTFPTWSHFPRRLPSAVRSSRKCEDLFFYLVRPNGFWGNPSLLCSVASGPVFLQVGTTFDEPTEVW
jgi:hypothetical protein